MTINDRQLKKLVKEATNNVLEEVRTFVAQQPHTVTKRDWRGRAYGKYTSFETTRNGKLEEILHNHMQQILDEFDEFVIDQENHIGELDDEEKNFQEEFSQRQETKLMTLLNKARIYVLDGMVDWTRQQRKEGKTNSRLN